jgi:hypothetical protein
MVRSAVSREVKASGVKLLKGDFSKIAKSIYHSTKDVPINQVLGGLGKRLSPELKPQHPFDKPIPFYEIDSELRSADKLIPPQVWIDSSAIDGKSYYPKQYSYYIQFVNIVRHIDGYFNKINDSGDDRMPHFLLTQPSQNFKENRWESVWLITDANGRALEGFDWNPLQQNLTIDQSLTEPQPKEPKTTTEPTTPKEQITPPDYKPEVDKAQAKAITDENLRANIKMVTELIEQIKKDIKEYKEMGIEEAVKEAKNELIEAIKTRTRLTSQT